MQQANHLYASFEDRLHASSAMQSKLMMTVAEEAEEEGVLAQRHPGIPGFSLKIPDSVFTSGWLNNWLC
jgi:hypothetical protein